MVTLDYASMVRLLVRTDFGMGAFKFLACMHTTAFTS